jgi:hypothetical protein
MVVTKTTPAMVEIHNNPAMITSNGLKSTAGISAVPMGLHRIFSQPRASDSADL